MTETEGVNVMIEAIGSGLTSVIGWIGEVLGAVVQTDGSLNALLPVFAIGVGVSLTALGVKFIRSLTWGA